MSIHKYQLVEEYLLRFIELNSKSGEPLKLPSENSLALRFGISRTTARAAIEKLVNNGIAYRIQGAGTFFNPPEEKWITKTLLSKKRISVVVPFSTSKFINSIIDGILDRLNYENCFTSVCFSHMDANREAHIINEISSSYISGMIIYPVDTSDFTQINRPFFSVPAIFIDRKPNFSNANFIASDHYGAMYAATQLLYDKGYQKICFIFLGNDNITSMKERIKGFNDAIVHSGQEFLQENFLHFQPGYSNAAYHAMMKKFLTENPHIDGIIIQSGNLSYILNNVLVELGRAPLLDIGIICYDHEIEDFMDPFTNKCAYINQNPHQLGYEAADNLLQIIQKKPASPLEKRINFTLSNTEVFSAINK